MAETRLESFDGLRGIAAVIVMVHHTLLTIPFWCEVIYRSTHRSTLQILLNYSPTNLLWAGRPSVLVFFALSGFVLALLFLGRNPTAIDFIGRRIVRIYVPYAGIVSFAILLMALFWTDKPNTTPWLLLSWNRPVSARLVIDHMLMLGNPTLDIVDNPIWSLVHEMRFSLIFPVLMWAVLRYRWKAVGTAAFISVAAILLRERLNFFWIVDSTQYLFLFVAGAELARNRFLARDLYQSLARPVRIVIGIFSLLCLSAYGFDGFRVGMVREIAALVPHVGAVLLLFTVNGSSTAHYWLTRAPLLWAGRVSYSLYLSHVVVLLTLLSVLHSFLNPLAILALFVPCTLILAEVLYRGLEQPAILWSRKVGSRPRAAILAHP
jgi:peptidoglycan/LPS O-acetylase OafA/YrhL